LLTRSLSKVFHLIQALNHNLCIKNEAFLSDTLVSRPRILPRGLCYCGWQWPAQ
jgi:hypothetical protein